MEMECDHVGGYYTKYKDTIAKGNLDLKFPPRCKMSSADFEIPMRYNPSMFVSTGP